ncbi:MAG: acetyltransferase [Thermodesulfobacteriota bacterium]|nr:acetyltransferase [Thermodesulfobacteriota bacterium]
MGETKKLVIFGTAMLAELAYIYFTTDSDYEVAAFTKDAPEEKRFCDLPVVDFFDLEKTYQPSKYHLFIPMSAKKCNQIRKTKFEEGLAKGFSFASYISSRATVLPEASIGKNCFILENNVIQSFAKIRDDVVLWSGNHIGHHSTIGSHCFLTSHVVISGRVIIGERCFFGVNSSVRDDVTIAKANIVGAGALIMKDTGPGQVFAERQTPVFPKSSDEINLE